MRRVHERIAAVNRRLGRIELTLSTLFLFLLVLANTVAVGGRLLFAIYPSWIIEVSAALVIATVFTGAAYLYKTGGHVAVTLLVDRLDPAGPPRRILSVIGEVLILIFVVVTLWQAAIYQPILFARLTTALQIPQNVVSIFIPLAYASILLSSVETLLGHWARGR